MSVITGNHKSIDLNLIRNAADANRRGMRSFLLIRVEFDDDRISGDQTKNWRLASLRICRLELSLWLPTAPAYVPARPRDIHFPFSHFHLDSVKPQRRSKGLLQERCILRDEEQTEREHPDAQHG